MKRLTDTFGLRACCALMAAGLVVMIVLGLATQTGLVLAFCVAILVVLLPVIVPRPFVPIFGLAGLSLTAGVVLSFMSSVMHQGLYGLLVSMWWVVMPPIVLKGIQLSVRLMGGEGR